MNSNNSGGPNKPGAEQTEMILNIIKRYQNEGGSDKLLNDIFDNVSKEKAAGRLNNEQILSFVKNVSPMLTSEQKRRLNELVEKLLKV